MSEEKKHPSPAPEQDKPAETEELSKVTKQAKSEKSVVRYISVLFAAAFVLLLFTFAMEARQHQQQMSDSQQQIEDLSQKSNSAVQSLNNMVRENEELKDELEQYLTDGKVWEEEKSQLETELGSRELSLKAMDYFWQISEACAGKRYTLARDLMEEMEAQQLVESLPRTSATGNDRLSPYERYMELHDKLY